MTGLGSLLQLYAQLLSWTLLGLVLGRRLPSWLPHGLGRFLFWVGVPLSVLGFLRQADLTGPVWLAAAVAWGGIALAAGLAMLWLRLAGASQLPPPATQGSFLLAAMLGNTGYIGYPVSLALCGPETFGWAVFYDTLGMTLGAYGLGVGLAARFQAAQKPAALAPANVLARLQPMLRNPTLLCFALALVSRPLPLPPLLELGLHQFAWSMIPLSLVLLGLRLSQLSSWHSLGSALPAVVIRLVLVPLFVGWGVSALGLVSTPRLAVVLQAAMPPAFATLVIAEAYDLDRELTVTALSLGSIGVLLTLPLWLWLFG